MREGKRKRREAVQAYAGTDERRRHKRFVDEVRVRYRDLEGAAPGAWGRTRDLSLGGLCLVSEAPVALGSHLALEIHVARETAPILALGRVVRIGEDSHEGNVTGVEFLWIGEDDRRNLRRLAEFFLEKHGETGEL